jgi:2-methylcitrate dehydratase PrpD
MSTILTLLAEYGARDAKRALPDEVMHHAKRAIVDWFAALYPGTRMAPATLLVKAHARELGYGACSLPGFNAKAFPATAAWINGSASHSAEFDDIYKDAAYHPGCPTIAAALALAQECDAPGRDFLNAVTIGYEISTRVGAAVQPSHYRYFHTTGTAGCLGGAAAGAALLAPGDAKVMLDALATATTFASGLQQAFRSDAMTKPLHAGHAAMVGVQAAMAAAQGVTGAADMLEGEAGFGNALADGGDWAVATRGLGEDYHITRVTQKNHGCCGHTFAAIDAVLALREAYHLRAEQIESILVETYQVAIDVTGNFKPVTASEAKFSLPYVIAHALVHGSVRLDAFGEARMAEAPIRALMQRVRVAADAQLSAAFPKQRAARVAVLLKDGRKVEHFAPCRKGDPEAPLTDAEINAKYDELAAPVIGEAQAAALRAQLWNLENLHIRHLVMA